MIENHKHRTEAIKKLENYRFSGLHASHLGAIKSALDYLEIPCTVEKLFGLSGHGFMMAVDEELCRPNVGLPESKLYALSENLGIRVEGLHLYAEGIDFLQGQRDAWHKIKALIDQGIPVFAKELDLGNEASLIYGYDETGYYTHSWHDGNPHGSEVIPWDKIGLNYCPCLDCQNGYQQESLREQDAEQRDEDKGYLWINWVEKGVSKDELNSMKEMLDFVLHFNQLGEYQWEGVTFYTGLRAYEQWIKRLVDGSIEAFYMGYFSEIWFESRYYGYKFLAGLQADADAAFSRLGEPLERVVEHYDKIQKNFKRLTDLFPWMQARTPIQDRAKAEEAVRILRNIQKDEEAALPYFIELRDELDKI